MCCATRVPKILTGAHKTQIIASALIFLERHQKDGYEFLNHIVRVTGDETWVSFVNVETKEQSKQWMHRKEALMVEFTQQWTTITSEVYCETLKILCKAIQNTKHGVLLHENARPHAAART
jgi:hypothetical protein